jgi:hypothetical protein
LQMQEIIQLQSVQIRAITLVLINLSQKEFLSAEIIYDYLKYIE